MVGLLPISFVKGLELGGEAGGMVFSGGLGFAPHFSPHPGSQGSQGEAQRAWPLALGP